MPLVIKSVRAERDLMDLWLYIEGRSGEDRANAVLRRINQKLTALAQQPGIGRSRPELGAGLRSLPVGSYIIFYNPIEDGIEVVRVLHGKRDMAAAFGIAEDDETDDEL